MSTSRRVFGRVGLDNRGQESADVLLKAIAGFGARVQEGLRNSFKGAVFQLDSFFQRSEIGCLCDLLDASEAHYHQLCSQLCAFQKILASKKVEFSAFVADNYCLTNSLRRGASEPKWKANLREDMLLIFVKHGFFIELGEKVMSNMVLRHNFIFVAKLHPSENVNEGSRLTFRNPVFDVSLDLQYLSH